MTEQEREQAIKRFYATPHPHVKPWPGTGRYESLPCRGCGQKCDPARRWCPACSEVMP